MLSYRCFIHRRDKQYKNTDEHPYRNPAAIVSLRPVILRPYLSVCLPTRSRLLSGSNVVNPCNDEKAAFLMHGKKTIFSFIYSMTFQGGLLSYKDNERRTAAVEFKGSRWRS
jgi:hypothetical protein